MRKRPIFVATIPSRPDESSKTIKPAGIGSPLTFRAEALTISNVRFEILPVMVITLMLATAGGFSSESAKTAAEPAMELTRNKKNSQRIERAFISNSPLSKKYTLGHPSFMNRDRQTMNGLRGHEISKLKSTAGLRRNQSRSRELRQTRLGLMMR